MTDKTYTAFAGLRRIAQGDLRAVLPAVKAHSDTSTEMVLIFALSNGRQVDFDLRGSVDEILGRLDPAGTTASLGSGGVSADQKAGKGRPRLGVVAGEVTLLPRHWEWLAAQPLKASGTLRRLVDEARAREASDPKKRIEALGTVLWALAGNLSNFEEASRALYAGGRERFLALIDGWPADMAAFARERLEETPAV
jgi:hypothetical protein